MIDDVRQVWEAFWNAVSDDRATDELDRLLKKHPNLARELPLLAELSWQPENASPDPWSTGDGSTLLRLADILVQIGGSLEARRHEGLTPLMLATKRGNNTLVEFLIGKGAMLKAQDDSGQNVLHMAANGRDLHMMKLILDGGLDPNQVDNLGQTPMHVLFDASYPNNPSLSALLLSHGASVDAQNNHGLTALHLLAKIPAYDWQEEGDELLRLLLKAGSHPFLEAEDGRSPWAIAVQAENDRFLAVVREAIRTNA